MRTGRATDRGVVRSYGRFTLETNDESVRLRVQRSDTVPLVRAAAQLFFALLLVVPGIVFSGPLQSAAVTCLGVVLLATGWASGRYAGLGRSHYRRVLHSVDVHLARSDGEGGPFRKASGGPVVTVDGQAFAPSDFLGVVTATSTERVPKGKTAVHVERCRPTLVMSQCGFELDVYEGADLASGRDLSDSLASAIAKHRTKAPCVEWAAPGPETPSSLFTFLQILLLVGAMLAGIAFSVSRPSHLWIASAILALLMVIDAASAKELARRSSRWRNYAAAKLLNRAHAALGR